MLLTRHVHFKIDMMDNNIYHRGCNIFIVVVIMETVVLIIYTFPARAHQALLFSRLTSRIPQAADSGLPRGIVGVRSCNLCALDLQRNSDSNKAFLLFSLLNSM